MPSMQPTLTVDIKRVQGITGGLEDEPTIVYSGISCLELYPIDPHMTQFLPVKPMGTIWQTITYDDVDILHNDLLVVSGVGNYPIIAVARWYARPIDTTYIILTMEDAV